MGWVLRILHDLKYPKPWEIWYYSTLRREFEGEHYGPGLLKGMLGVESITHLGFREIMAEGGLALYELCSELLKGGYLGDHIGEY